MRHVRYNTYVYACDSCEPGDSIRKGKMHEGRGFNPNHKHTLFPFWRKQPTPAVFQTRRLLNTLLASLNAIVPQSIQVAHIPCILGLNHQ